MIAVTIFKTITNPPWCSTYQGVESRLFLKLLSYTKNHYSHAILGSGLRSLFQQFLWFSNHWNKCCSFDTCGCVVIEMWWQSYLTVDVSITWTYISSFTTLPGLACCWLNSYHMLMLSSSEIYVVTVWQANIVYYIWCTLYWGLVYYELTVF